jgi:hypothetical protein
MGRFLIDHDIPEGTHKSCDSGGVHALRIDQRAGDKGKVGSIYQGIPIEEEEFLFSHESYLLTKLIEIIEMA